MIKKPRDYLIKESNFKELINNNSLDYSTLLEGVLKGITDIIGVYRLDGSIMFYNQAGYEFYNTSFKEVAGKKCYEMLSRNCRCELCTTKLALKTGKLVQIEKYVPELRKYMDCRCNPVFNSQGEVVLVVEHLRDITEERTQLNRAANIQKQSLIKEFPLPHKGILENLYIPAKTVSGDNYSIHSVGDNLVVGIIYDVSGKGVTAALNVSAFNVMFNEAIIKYKSPKAIINYLNKKALSYLNENYVAACCFSFDFNKGEAEIVAAGINRFMVKSSQGAMEERVIKGPFLGMFNHIPFDEVRISFKEKDSFYFFTDGLDEIFDNKEIYEKINDAHSITGVKELINNHISERYWKGQPMGDDCTLLAIEIK